MNLYFIRRSCEAGENKQLHKELLRESIDRVLKNVFLKLGINYDKNELSYNSHGKPYLKNYPDVFFNISHCHELAVCAVGSFELGVDTENIRAYSSKAVKRAFSDREIEILEKSKNKDETFFRIWTLKESFVKAIGIGISYPLKSCEFLVNEFGFTVYGCDGYSFLQIILNDCFVCSLCIKDTKALKNILYRLSSEEEFFSLCL